MQQKVSSTSGNLKVSEAVVSTIVKQVISETEGVQGLALPPVTPKDVVLKSGVMKPVKITLSGDVAVIDINVVLNIGFKVKDVAETLQNDIKEEVQNMTGVTVSAVNVYVADVTARK